MQRSKKEKKVIQKTEEIKIPTVFFYIDSKISKLIFEPDLDKIQNSFNVEIVEEKGRQSKYTITSNDIRNCRKACSVLEKIAGLLDRNIEPTDADIDEFISDLSPKPFKETKYKGFFRTYKNEDISPRTENQEKILDCIKNNSISIISGKPGTGKTKLSCAFALNLLNNNRFESFRIIRSITQVSKDYGFVPGSKEEKLQDFYGPIYSILSDLISDVELEQKIKDKKILFEPVNFIRGCTFEDEIVLIDETQNFTKKEVETICSRFSPTSVLIFVGDNSQVDIKTNKELNGLDFMIERLQDIDGIGFVKMQECDIQRNKLIGEIIRAFE